MLKIMTLCAVSMDCCSRANTDTEIDHYSNSQRMNFMA